MFLHANTVHTFFTLSLLAHPYLLCCFIQCVSLFVCKFYLWATTKTNINLYVTHNTVFLNQLPPTLYLYSVVHFSVNIKLNVSISLFNEFVTLIHKYCHKKKKFLFLFNFITSSYYQCTKISTCDKDILHKFFHLQQFISDHACWVNFLYCENAKDKTDQTLLLSVKDEDKIVIFRWPGLILSLNSV